MNKDRAKYWLKYFRLHGARLLMFSVFALGIGFATGYLLSGLLSDDGGQITPESYQTTEEALVERQREYTYIVQPGDSTWKLAEDHYGDGFDYVKIEQVNGLEHDQHLEIGQELIIPALDDSEVFQRGILQQNEIQTEQESDQRSELYEIQPGDSLWSIAEVELGDGQRWVEIWGNNSEALVHADLIYPGQFLLISS